MLFRNAPVASSSANIPDYVLPFIMANTNLMQNIAGAALQYGVPHPFPSINPNAPVHTPPGGLMQQHSTESNGTPFPLLDLQTAAALIAAVSQHAGQAIPQLNVYPSQSQPNPVVYL